MIKDAYYEVHSLKHGYCNYYPYIGLLEIHAIKDKKNIVIATIKHYFENEASILSYGQARLNDAMDQDS